ncbi:hypothetical protein SAMN05216388_1004262 [Halorientalis persicus]|uniref:Ribbon-helix-helix protein, copG family n=1 Tax=Halorientalis persicus TaxID=1367881 RepID=A0A1H8IU48_9EURY|nr:hypothetical protein [Halorientalis persicus]SEN71507.1 hypothetical protein SAMN05216388_1004262 [Halorientalis persicus]
MEIRLRLDDDLVAELDEEAQLQGFDDRGAYLRWIVANRPMSDLATTQAPAVASRVSELEERVKLLERQLDLDEPTNPDTDLGQSGGTGTASTGADTGGAELEPSTTSEPDDTAGGEPASLDEDIEPEQEAMDLDEDEESEEEAAADDDIAEAIGDVSLEDDDEE